MSFPDLLQTTGSYQVVQDLPFVLGIEGAGFLMNYLTVHFALDERALSAPAKRFWSTAPPGVSGRPHCRWLPRWG
ncbi:hypothetical protein NOF53_20950 [Rhodococcus sp. FXJ9.536]|uniref:Uncharacterized protein n=1 Tax=Rhodococcus tibetensis TaxID=2965064 RepID=A0ABT1QKM0_9NOCA|nr:hypothetical protein [Rhodococcus sp. FXJ9.536]